MPISSCRDAQPAVQKLLELPHGLHRLQLATARLCSRFPSAPPSHQRGVARDGQPRRETALRPGRSAASVRGSRALVRPLSSPYTVPPELLSVLSHRSRHLLALAHAGALALGSRARQPAPQATHGHPHSFQQDAAAMSTSGVSRSWVRPPSSPLSQPAQPQLTLSLPHRHRVPSVAMLRLPPRRAPVAGSPAA